MTDILLNNIYADYISGMSFKRLKNKYNIASTSIYRELQQRNLLDVKRKVKRYKDYNTEPYITFKKLYIEDCLSINEIAKICNCSICKVQKYLEKQHLTRTNKVSKILKSKNNMINANWFDEINMPEKAYWLGFLMADGYISKDNYACVLSLAKKDEKHLSRFANIFNLEMKQYKRYDKRTQKVYYSTTVSITNKYLVSQLINIGVSNNKTYRLNQGVFNNIPEEFKRDFIRGYFDGDGSACGNSLSLTSCSEKFLFVIGDYITEKLNIEKYSIYKYKNATTISWYKNDNLKKFHHWLYSNTDLYLKRKEQDVKKFITPKLKHWTDEEILKLEGLNKKYFYDKSYIEKLFPNRTYGAVYRKYRRLNSF